ncbi:MAG TPA: flagellar basal body P-ring formation chaperone FlgA, partial [Spirochaetia bacterium]|nr:flagellar basal body P-ring formation chaperone FlgA [Spirochaetia bacterium]
ALIPARDIRAAIAPILRRSIVIVGGPLVYLPATVTDKSEIRFYEALLDHLGRHLPDVRIEAAIPEGRSPDLSGIQGALQFQLPGGEDSASALLRNRFVEYRGEYDADWSFVPIRFRAFVLTPVAKQRIAVGSRFSGADVDYAEIDARALHGAPAPLSSGSYQADATIDQGAPIFADMVRVIHAIRSGERINVSFSRGSIEVTVPGTAFSSGNIGDLISVAPLSGAKRFSGTIVSPSEVRVDD